MLFVHGYHLGVRHVLAALTAGPLPSAHSASVNFSAMVPQKLPLHHLLSYVCKMWQNFKPVHGHGDFQRVTGDLRDCIYAFPLQVLMLFKLLMRLAPHRDRHPDFSPAEQIGTTVLHLQTMGFVSLQPSRGRECCIGVPEADAGAQCEATHMVSPAGSAYHSMLCLHHTLQCSGKPLTTVSPPTFWQSKPNCSTWRSSSFSWNMNMLQLVSRLFFND